MTRALPLAAIALDAMAVEALTCELLSAVKAHYRRRPTAGTTAQEVLNALAITTAVIIAGARECGDEDGARDFFELALNNQLSDMADTGVHADG